MSGFNESNSCHKTLNDNSDNVLQVRASRERERLPPGVSRTVVRTLVVTSWSRRITGGMIRSILSRFDCDSVCFDSPTIARYAKKVRKGR
jgi:hypothetical protein